MVISVICCMNCMIDIIIQKQSPIIQLAHQEIIERMNTIIQSIREQTYDLSTSHIFIIREHYTDAQRAYFRRLCNRNSIQSTVYNGSAEDLVRNLTSNYIMVIDASITSFESSFVEQSMSIISKSRKSIKIAAHKEVTHAFLNALIKFKRLEEDPESRLYIMRRPKSKKIKLNLKMQTQYIGVWK